MEGKKINILGVHTDGQPFKEAVDRLVAWAKSNGKYYVSTSPVYTLMQCFDNPHIMKAINGSDMITADGVPVVWVQRMRGTTKAERCYGPDLMLAVSEKTAGTNVSHFYLGGGAGVAEKLRVNLQAKFPGLQVAGTDSPMIAKQPVIDQALVKRLNDSGASIIWVGLGSPKQDLFMEVYRPVLNAPLLIAVGAAFDFHAGTIPQAPKWMQKSGLEWLFRLAQEPRRLAGRYLIHNPRYIYHVLREQITGSWKRA
jgi:N-acetylglucosaminyldiphosphoundecaprenol N-acetyl-beta-D-mannosaminyltransferase